MTYDTLLVERDGPLATIRLHRPDRMNAVIEGMYRDLAAALAALADDGETRAVVLTGSPRVRDGVEKPAFCAGADLKEHGAGSRGPAERRAYIELAHDTVRRLLEFPRPVVAAVTGPARGAGTELALACDFIVMADEATIALPEVGLGTFVGGAATLTLPRLVGAQRARELIYTGRVLDGPAAVEAGLALRSAPASEAPAVALELAATLARQAPVSLAHAKRLLREAPAGDLESALRAETEAILDCMETDDWHEGVRAFAERRPPRFRGR